MRLLPVLLVCVAAALAAPAPDSDHYGIPDSVYSMFKCTACERAVGNLRGKLTDLILRDAQWTKEVKKEVWTHMKSLCLNKELFPSGGDELYLKSCAILFRDHHKQLLGAFRRRLDPEHELYHQDFYVKPLCLEIGGCEAGVGSMDEALAPKNEL